MRRVNDLGRAGLWTSRPALCPAGTPAYVRELKS